MNASRKIDRENGSEIGAQTREKGRVEDPECGGRRNKEICRSSVEKKNSRQRAMEKLGRGLYSEERLDDDDSNLQSQ